VKINIKFRKYWKILLIKRKRNYKTAFSSVKTKFMGSHCFGLSIRTKQTRPNQNGATYANNIKLKLLDHKTKQFFQKTDFSLPESMQLIRSSFYFSLYTKVILTDVNHSTFSYFSVPWFHLQNPMSSFCQWEYSFYFVEWREAAWLMNHK
jgi:hypothetical protein